MVSNSVPHDHVDKLLKILKPRLLPSIPKSTKTLLKCHVDISNIEEMAVSNGSIGEFKDYGISKSIVKMVKRFMTNDLASQFTAIRTSTKDKTKYKFRPTTLCTIIKSKFILFIYQSLLIYIYYMYN